MKAKNFQQMIDRDLSDKKVFESIKKKLFDDKQSTILTNLRRNLSNLK